MEQIIHEACGVFGACLPGEDAARTTFFGIFSLQHRGQESAGIATADVEGRLHSHRGMGLVARVFDEESLATLPGPLAIGHNRYSTTGSSRLANAQPLRALGPGGDLYLAHNGNIVNAEPLRRELEDRGALFEGTTDSEVIANLIALSPGSGWEERISSAMRRLEGAYSLTILVKDAVFAVRDPHGFRPLCYGRLGSGWVVASETCALENVGATIEREVEPGELLRLDLQGVSGAVVRREQQALCIFEHIYFSRPDSLLGGRRVYLAREAMGAQLAREHPVEADLVTAIPDSATAAGIGYAREAGIPYAETLVKNRYVGRTFIQPDQRLRDQGVRIKFTPLTEVIQGKRLVVVDDSIVRGTTTPHVVN
ncbi:MAG: amidophosphoribosyltransferase, partial [Chloroflexi bacterium]|nr:amidophosphoribosyltransferase [Chloroflexota bacterium]